MGVCVGEVSNGEPPAGQNPSRFLEIFGVPVATLGTGCSGNGMRRMIRYRGRT